MTLFIHIQYLLRQHDCVIVPGLGAFIAVSSPTQIDMVNMRIFPPSRIVSFNQALKEDDGLLVNSFARKNLLTFEDARMAIVHEVSEIQKKLNEGEIIECGSLGTLRLQEEFKPVFSPQVAAQSDLLGFYPVNIVNDTEMPVKTNDFIIPQRKIMPLVNIAVAVCLLIAVAVGFLLFPIPDDSREHRASVLPVEVLLKNSKSETKEPEVKVHIDTETNADVSPDAPLPHPNHFLIVGTFSSPKEAERYISMNSSDDYLMTAVQSTKLTRVSIASSSDRNELRRLLNSAKIAKRFPNAWIWSRE